MSYQVVWDADAFRKLEQMWEDAPDVGPVVDAFDEIERRIVPPLGVLFRVQPRLNEVYVIELWRFRGPNS